MCARPNPWGDQNKPAVLRYATRWRCHALEMARTPPSANAALEWEVTARQPVPAGACDTESCRIEVLEHKQDQVLREPGQGKKTSNHKVRKCSRSGWQDIHTLYTDLAKQGWYHPEAGIPQAACLSPRCFPASALFWSSELPTPLPRVLGVVDFMHELFASSISSPV